MAELQLDKSQCSTYNQQLTQELDNYTKVVNEIGTQANGIPGAWTGFNIIEKSGTDLTTSVNNTTATDERSQT